MKKKKINKKTPKLPKIYRFITEKASWVAKNRTVIVSTYTVIYLVVIAVVAYLTISFYSNFKKYQNASSEQVAIVRQIKSWQGILRRYPDFKDAYLQLAVLEYRLRNYQQAKIYCDKALLLDPEYSDAIELDKKLRGIK
jgi:tetratricopeptide (TPR) repeat protein